MRRRSSSPSRRSGRPGRAPTIPASDLTLLYASGIAKLLTGQVDDLAEAPIRPVGEQSAFIGGLAAACACMGASPGSVVDVSIEEALATMAMTELANAGLGGKARPRKRVGDGNGATVDDPAGQRRLRRDLAARGSAMGRVARGHGIARMGPRPALCDQT